MIKSPQVCSSLLMLGLCLHGKAQNGVYLPEKTTGSDIVEIVVPNAPNYITRTIVEDRSANIWIATFAGVFRYYDSSFTNVTAKVSSSRFFSVLEDSKGNMWFGSIGAGVYRYNGKSFQNFTSHDGLVGDEIVCIYEDKQGDIWFGVNGGLSRYDGSSFRNYVIKGGTIVEDTTNSHVMNFTSNQRRSDSVNEVNTILQDKTGKFWFGTRGKAFIYDGETFVAPVYNNMPFTNVRWIIEDRKGNIWLGGDNGLWRYDGRIFTNITKNFVGYIYEDGEGNIWTSSQNDVDGSWMLSRYDEKSLLHDQPQVTEIKSMYEGGKGMIFGILEASDGSIWFGGLDGVYRYNGNTINRFKRE